MFILWLWCLHILLFHSTSSFLNHIPFFTRNSNCCSWMYFFHFRFLPDERKNYLMVYIHNTFANVTVIILLLIQLATFHFLIHRQAPHCRLKHPLRRKTLPHIRHWLSIIKSILDIHRWTDQIQTAVPAVQIVHTQTPVPHTHTTQRRASHPEQSKQPPQAFNQTIHPTRHQQTHSVVSLIQRQNQIHSLLAPVKAPTRSSYNQLNYHWDQTCYQLAIPVPR